MTIGKKLAFCLVGMIAACGILGAVGWFFINDLGVRLDEAIQVTARRIELAGALRASVFTFRLQERGMLLFSHIQAAEQVSACGVAYDKAMIASLARIGEVRPLITSGRDREAMDQAEAGVQEYKTQQLEVRRLLAAGQVSEATVWDKKMLVPAGARIIAALDRFDGQQHSINAKTNEDAKASRKMAKAMLAFGLLMCACIGLLASFTIRGIIRALKEAIAGLSEGAAQVLSASVQIAGSSQSLSQGASEQAASLEETSASSEEMASMTRKNAENSQEATQLMATVIHRVTEANTTLDKMMTSMQEIDTSSNKISKIIKVIDEIAFQTNILALNAAVEAARAGEAGMGFAVVADEVRNLAGRSAEAAKDTASLIADSIQKSGEGSKRLGEVAASIRGITEGAAQARTLSDEVEASSKEQARGIEQISKAVAQLDDVTQRTAANAEECASASEELNAQSQALMGVVEHLETLAGADHGYSRAGNAKL